MNPENIFNSKNVKTIIFITVIVVILGLVFSFVSVPKYKSSAKLLVIFSQKDMNPYTSAQTSNYLAGILAEVMYSDSFINNVFKTDFDLNDDLGLASDKKIKNWKKMVKVKLEDNKGLIILDIYHKDKEQAYNFAQAISSTLITTNNLYHGSGENVTVKMISAPSIGYKWAKPDVWQNLLLSIMAGIFIGLTFVIIFPEQELINFVFRKKIVTKDEVIIFGSLPQDRATGLNSNRDYYNR